MTLKEKIQTIIILDDSGNLQKILFTEDLFDEFAIGFAEWMRGFRYDNTELYFRSSTKELLEIYKKEKGL